MMSTTISNIRLQVCRTFFVFVLCRTLLQKYCPCGCVIHFHCELCSCLFKERITSAGGRVIVVSFGIKEFAQRWLQDVHCPFPMVLDPDRKVSHVLLP